jgi:putative oxidoreductase
MLPLLDAGLVLLRVVTGLTLAAHGAQKLFGWFGGHGISGTTGFFHQLGLRPAKPLAILVGLVETFGGLALALGFLTPVAAALLTADMIAAIALVHWTKGFWNYAGGFEYNLILTALALFLGLVGPGAYALDPLLGLNIQRPEVYLASLLVSLVVTAIILALRQPEVRPVQAPATS